MSNKLMGDDPLVQLAEKKFAKTKVEREILKSLDEARPGLGSGTGVLPADVAKSLTYEAREAIAFLKEAKQFVGTTIGQISNAARHVDKRNGTFSVSSGEDYIDGMISALEKFVSNPYDKAAIKNYMNFYEKANNKGAATFDATALAKMINAMDSKSISVYGTWLSNSGNKLYNLLSGMQM